MPLTVPTRVEHEILPAPGARLQLKVAKTGLFSGRKHLFSFPRFRGVVRFDRDRPADSSVELEMDVRALVVEDDWVSAKDRAKIKEHTEQQMLDVARHPMLRFASSEVQAAGDRIRVVGALTVRGVTRAVEVSVLLREASDEGLVLEGYAMFPMTRFGLTPPSTAFGAIGTRDEMEFEFVLKTRPR